MTKVSDSCKIKVLAIRPIPADITTFDNSLVRDGSWTPWTARFRSGRTPDFWQNAHSVKSLWPMGRAMIDFGRFAQLCGHWAILTAVTWPRWVKPRAADVTYRICRLALDPIRGLVPCSWSVNLAADGFSSMWQGGELSPELGDQLPESYRF